MFFTRTINSTVSIVFYTVLYLSVILTSTVNYNIKKRHYGAYKIMLKNYGYYKRFFMLLILMARVEALCKSADVVGIIKPLIPKTIKTAFIPTIKR